MENNRVTPSFLACHWNVNKTIILSSECFRLNAPERQQLFAWTWEWNMGNNELTGLTWLPLFCGATRPWPLELSSNKNVFERFIFPVGDERWFCVYFSQQIGWFFIVLPLYKWQAKRWYHGSAANCPQAPLPRFLLRTRSACFAGQIFFAHAFVRGPVRRQAPFRCPVYLHLAASQLRILRWLWLSRLFRYGL